MTRSAGEKKLLVGRTTTKTPHKWLHSGGGVGFFFLKNMFGRDMLAESLILACYQVTHWINVKISDSWYDPPLDMFVILISESDGLLPLKSWRYLTVLHTAPLRNRELESEFTLYLGRRNSESLAPAQTNTFTFTHSHFQMFTLICSDVLHCSALLS